MKKILVLVAVLTALPGQTQGALLTLPKMPALSVRAQRWIAAGAALAAAAVAIWKWYPWELVTVNLTVQPRDGVPETTVSVISRSRRHRTGHYNRFYNMSESRMTGSPIRPNFRIPEQHAHIVSGYVARADRPYVVITQEFETQDDAKHRSAVDRMHVFSGSQEGPLREERVTSDRGDAYRLNISCGQEISMSSGRIISTDQGHYLLNNVIGNRWCALKDRPGVAVDYESLTFMDPDHGPRIVPHA